MAEFDLTPFFLHLHIYHRPPRSSLMHIQLRGGLETSFQKKSVREPTPTPDVLFSAVALEQKVGLSRNLKSLRQMASLR